MASKSQKSSKTTTKSKSKNSSLNEKKSSATTKKKSGVSKRFDTYIKKIQVKVQPTLTLGNKSSLPMLNDIVLFIIEKVAEHSSALLRIQKHVVLTSREVQAAASLVLGGEMFKQARKFATLAITRFNGTFAAGTRDENIQKKREGMKISKAERAGIIISVSRISKVLYSFMQGTGIRHGAGAAIYLGAIIQYILQEIIASAGRNTLDLNKKKIVPEHLVWAIRGNEELDHLFPNTIIQGGVIPHIHKSLIKKTNRKSKNENE